MTRRPRIRRTPTQEFDWARWCAVNCHGCVHEHNCTLENRIRDGDLDLLHTENGEEMGWHPDEDIPGPRCLARKEVG